MAILVQSNKKPSVSYPEQTGAIITFNSQYAGLPLKSCKVDIPVTQEGTGDPSPDNVRNFVGISSLDFTANSVVKTFTFGQTVYSGVLDVLTGVFTATHKLVRLVDEQKDNWKVGSKTVCYRVLLSDKSTSVNYSQVHGCLCNMMNVEQASYWGVIRPNDMDNNCYAISQDGTLLTIYDSDLTLTEADFLTKYSDFTCFYPLKTPKVINLGGMNIETLQGENNLFASTGETTASIIKIGG